MCNVMVRHTIVSESPEPETSWTVRQLVRQSGEFAVGGQMGTETDNLGLADVNQRSGYITQYSGECSFLKHWIGEIFVDN